MLRRFINYSSLTLIALSSIIGFQCVKLYYLTRNIMSIEDKLRRLRDEFPTPYEGDVKENPLLKHSKTGLTDQEKLTKILDQNTSILLSIKHLVDIGVDTKKHLENLDARLTRLETILPNILSTTTAYKQPKLEHHYKI